MQGLRGGLSRQARRRSPRSADAADALGEAVRRYEALEDLLGRIMSYAGLVYAGDTTDPKRAKFYGDTQERLTAASRDLLFFTLELNRIDDAVLDAAMPTRAARPLPALARGHPQGQAATSSRTSIEQLFHEKSVTGRAAWNRLFDETIASLRFEVDGEELTLEPTLNKLQDADGTLRRDAAEALAETFKANLRLFTLITNTLAKDKEISDRWRGFEDVADSRHLANRVEREVVEALVAAVREAYPRLSHRYYRAEGEVVRQRPRSTIGTATRRCRRSSSARSRGPRRATRCSTPMPASRRAWPTSPGASSTSAGSTRRSGPARRPAPSRIRRCRRRTPMCCSTTRASRAT